MFFSCHIGTCKKIAALKMPAKKNGNTYDYRSSNGTEIVCSFFSSGNQFFVIITKNCFSAFHREQLGSVRDIDY